MERPEVADRWRLNEIQRLVDHVMDSANTTDVDAWFTLGKIYAILTTPDGDIEAVMTGLNHRHGWSLNT